MSIDNAGTLDIETLLQCPVPTSCEHPNVYVVLVTPTATKSDSKPGVLALFVGYVAVVGARHLDVPYRLRAADL